MALCLAAVSLCVTGCLKKRESEERNDSKLIAIVNGDRITAKDIRRELTIRTKQDPSFKITPETLVEQLESMVNRRLLIQEATRRRLAEDERFVHTLRSFWEQTLIRGLTEDLSKEFSDSVVVSDAEITRYYDNLAYKAAFDVKKFAKKDEAELFVLKAKSDPTVKWDQRIGPIGFEETGSEVLERAFQMAKGEIGLFGGKGIFYAVRVAEKERVIAPPSLDKARPRIVEWIRRKKEKAAFDEWLADRRKRARIRVFSDKTEKLK